MRSASFRREADTAASSADELSFLSIQASYSFFAREASNYCFNVRRSVNSSARKRSPQRDFPSPPRLPDEQTVLATAVGQLVGEVRYAAAVAKAPPPNPPIQISGPTTASLSAPPPILTMSQIALTEHVGATIYNAARCPRIQIVGENTLVDIPGRIARGVYGISAASILRAETLAAAASTPLRAITTALTKTVSRLVALPMAPPTRAPSGTVPIPMRR